MEKQLSKPSSIVWALLWVFMLPLVLGLITQMVISVLICAIWCGFSFYWYGRNYYVIKADKAQLMASNPINVWSLKYQIPFQQIASYRVLNYKHRTVVLLYTHSSQKLFIPAYHLDHNAFTQIMVEQNIPLV